MTVRPGPSVFFELFSYELKESTESFRFRATALIIVILMVVSALICSARYRRELEKYHESLTLVANAYRGLTVGQLAEAVHSAVKPPWRLAFLADGEQSGVPDVYRHSPDHLSFEAELASRDRVATRLHEVEALDWLYLLQVVLPLGAFLLGYDAICAARQRRRLQLLYSFAVPRSKAFAAKLLALWTCVALPFLGGALLSLSIVVGYGTLRFRSEELLKIGGIVLLGLWAAALFVTMALCISALHRETSHSLLIAALLWVTAVVIVPSAGGLLARMARPLPSDWEVSRQLRVIDREIEAEEGFGTWRSKDIAKTDGYARERRSAELENHRFARQEAIRRALVRDQLGQVYLARRLASLSPMFLIKDLGERLVGTGPTREQRFVEAAWAFREVLAQHIRKLDLEDPESPHIKIFVSRYLSARPVQTEEIPQFSFAEATIGQGMRSAVGPLALLALWSFFVAAVTTYYWKRYNVG